jgi:nucleotide-binding universal stress UspA family protein
MTNSGSTTKPLIVVGVDGSEPSKEAMRWAIKQAQLTGAELRVVTAWHPPTLGHGTVTPLAVDIDYEKASKETLRREIEEVAGPTPVIPMSMRLVAGLPARELVAAAEGADLLVVGSRGHGAFTGMLLGSVSSHCVSQASCPVAVIRGGHA